MPNDFKADEFYIDSFEPRHLKKARLSLEKHLKTAQQHEATNDGYKKGVLKEVSFWEKVKHTLHLD
jgi:glycerophosphoryl diester phosphodiesterase